MSYFDNHTNFEEWFNLLINDNESVVPFCKIPFDYFDEYIENVHSFSQEEVMALLRLLLKPFTTVRDIQKYELFHKLNALENNVIKMDKSETVYRLENEQQAWEGLTWVLSFLPHRPYKAIKALEHYVISEPDIPDDRLFGIDQCAQIITEKFINFDQGIETLTKLKSRQFEMLIENLYKWMGYKTVLTAASRDGGKDIIAIINRTDGEEVVYVECKLYTTTKIKTETVRSLSAIITNEQINRGVIYCTGYVSGRLKEYDKRIQIKTYEEINILLNEHLGSEWPKHLKHILKLKR